MRSISFVYSSRWPAMTTSRSSASASFSRPAFWKVPGYELPTSYRPQPTPKPPLVSLPSPCRRRSSSGLKKRVHFADEQNVGVSPSGREKWKPQPLSNRPACQSSRVCSFLIRIPMYLWPQFTTGRLRNQFNNISPLAARKFVKPNLINWPLLHFSVK